MSTRMRAIPLTYTELAAAIDGGVYPHERSWIDFKRRLYTIRPGFSAEVAGFTESAMAAR